ncbi:MAG: GWxTD domain-containing protein [Candidatus Kapabacteria bacterium]|nr:GWxTD domain-containing protein [Candidatus Kapabacteria bacterium]
MNKRKCMDLIEKYKKIVNWKTVFTHIILFFSISLPIFSKSIPFYLEASVYRESPTIGRWELYYSFPDTAIKYIPNEFGYIGNMKISIQIKSDSLPEIKKEWLLTNQLINRPNDFENLLVGQMNFSIPNGKYTAYLNISDANDSNTRDGAPIKLIVPKFPDNKLCMSDIEFSCFMIDRNSDTSKLNEMFVKWGKTIIPNPTDEYNYLNKNLFIFYEIYKPKSWDNNAVVAVHSILDGMKRIIYKDTLTITDSNSTVPLFYMYKLDSFPTGVYFCKTQLIKLNDGLIEDSCSKLKKFYYTNPFVKSVKNTLYQESESFEQSEFASLTPELTDLEFKMASVIATKDEKESWNNLNEIKGKQRYLYKFWLIRDPNPDTKINEKREEFLSCVEMANMQFAVSFNRQGWNTERGQILLKMGKPTKRDIHIATQGNRAYEEWFYAEKFGGVYYYFVDKSGFNNFILVHSTVPGETYNANWYNDNVPENAPQTRDRNNSSIKY